MRKYYVDTKNNVHEVRVVVDSAPLNPRTDFDNISTMYLWSNYRGLDNTPEKKETLDETLKFFIDCNINDEKILKHLKEYENIKIVYNRKEKLYSAYKTGEKSEFDVITSILEKMDAERQEKAREIANNYMPISRRLELLTKNLKEINTGKGGISKYDKNEIVRLMIHDKEARIKMMPLFDKDEEWSNRTVTSLIEESSSKGCLLDMLVDSLSVTSKIKLLCENDYVIVPFTVYEEISILSDDADNCSGFAYVRKDEMLNKEDLYLNPRTNKLNKITASNWKEAARLWIEGEIETYNMYLKGEVYGVIDENLETGETSSCWGFYSDNVGDELFYEVAKDFGLTDVAWSEKNKKYYLVRRYNECCII